MYGAMCMINQQAQQGYELPHQMAHITILDVRQLFRQLRDAKMQHITQLQHQIHRLMQQGQG